MAIQPTHCIKQKQSFVAAIQVDAHWKRALVSTKNTNPTNTAVLEVDGSEALGGVNHFVTVEMFFLLLRRYSSRSSLAAVGGVIS